MIELSDLKYIITKMNNNKDLTEYQDRVINFLYKKDMSRPQLIEKIEKQTNKRVPRTTLYDHLDELKTKEIIYKYSKIPNLKKKGRFPTYYSINYNKIEEINKKIEEEKEIYSRLFIKKGMRS